MRASLAALLCAALTGPLTSVSACAPSGTLSGLPAGAGAAAPSPSALVTATGPTPTDISTTTLPTPIVRVTAPAAGARSAPRPAGARPARATPALPKPPPPRPKPSPPSCAVPSGVTSRQVVLVDAHGSGATVRACERSGSRYRQVLGPYAGHVGQGGVSSAKREADLRTPVGVFPLRGGFGVNGNPGLRTGSWLKVDALDVWVDDPRSALYNTHQRSPARGRWVSAERLHLSPAYNYAQVIGYNEARTPGAGSAIFLHVDQGRGTAGCVSLPTSALLSVMRWERPGVVIAITA